jgi:hypothetical protein
MTPARAVIWIVVALAFVAAWRETQPASSQMARAIVNLF